MLLMASMNVSFIVTVYNEESTIEALLYSLLIQSKVPDEIIIVDGGSSDRTVAKIQNVKFKMQNYSSKFKIIKKRGNRSIGRNEAIRKTSGDVILCSDAGCVLDKKWIENIIKPFKDKTVDVVAGYYRGKPRSIFEKCLIPYVLVMPDRVNSDNFLPATRSMAFRKEIWRKIGGFDERFFYNEDYVFARRLKEKNAKIVFQKDAIVYWLPRENIQQAFLMFYSFAKGDAESHIFRPKVIMLFSRYIIGLLLIVFYAISKSYIILNTLYLILFIYVLWAIIKNFKYVNEWRAFYYLPLIQITSDTAVIMGTTIGVFRRKKASRNYGR